MNTITYLKKSSLWLFLLTSIAFTSCNDEDDAPEENEEEVITDITLVFTNENDSNDVVTATATDPDGEGLDELIVEEPINLASDKTYVLTLEIMNNLDEPGESISEEIEEEDEEHQLFFSFTNDAFSNPLGNGNIDNASDIINYNDFDENENPVGLSTSWSTGSNTVIDGYFTVKLQHQPDIKTNSTGANDGDTDFELEFVLNIQ